MPNLGTEHGANETPVTVRQLLSDAEQRLVTSEQAERANASIPLPATSTRLDAEVLLGFVLSKERPWLYAHPDDAVDARSREHFSELIEQRMEGSPIAYLTGRQEFWSLDLTVNESVLVPRGETELLVTLVLESISAIPKARILELGTGTGAISLALASERADLAILATDVSAEALKVAAANREKHQTHTVELLHTDWFEGISQRDFDVVVSNPPYVRVNDEHLTMSGVCREPLLALTSGDDGLDAIRIITREACKFLRAGGDLFLEHGHDQGDAVADLLQQHRYTAIELIPDHAGQPRVTRAVCR